ncbi:MAG: peptidylprolyl isomerase [Gemmatimonadota bacterium]
MRALKLLLPVALVAMALTPVPGAGQVDTPSPGTDEMVDRIVAVVGDSIVLHSEILNELNRMQAAGQPIPSDPEGLAALQREVTEGFVEQLLLVQAAERDSTVVVADDRVESAVDGAWSEQVQRFGGEAELLATLEESGISAEEYRRELRSQIRRNLLLQAFFQSQRSRIQQVAVEEAEVREYFESERERLGQRPATLTVRQLFFQATPSDSARAAARERAQEIRKMVLEGEDFNELAQRFSDDVGSRQQGGDIGWHRRGDGLVQEFEDAAFTLLERQISPIVETDYGAHILRVERVRGPERRIHHILVAASTTEADRERVRARVQEVAEALREGAPFSQFQSEAAEFGIPDSLTVARDQLQEFPDAYAQALEDAPPGEVIGPIEFALEQGVTAYAVARIEDVRDAGAFTFEDVRDQIRGILREQKLEEQLLQELRARTYVDIRL